MLYPDMVVVDGQSACLVTPAKDCTARPGFALALIYFSACW